MSRPSPYPPAPRVASSVEGIPRINVASMIQSSVPMLPVSPMKVLT